MAASVATLSWLKIANFRCLRGTVVEPAPGFNVFSGENASGKTSLLEAIFFLGRGRSFREHRPENLIREGADAFEVVARQSGSGRGSTIGVRREQSRTLARIGGENAANLAELARQLPVQVIDPDIHKLIEEGPAYRRRYIDWGVFHVKPGFLDAWRRYQRALRQRNAALKNAAGEEAVRLWEPELAECGEAIDQWRGEHLESLQPVATGLVEQLLGEGVELCYRRGWAQDQPLASSLEAHRARDREARVTGLGPHRANLIIRWCGRLAKQRVSRGEQKLLGAALVLAQARLHREQTGRAGVLLLDDPAAELDASRLQKLLAAVRELDTQVFITTLQASEIPDLGDARMFHVKQGEVTPMVY
ncbi:MAG: DNA replication/repair protein RecF [Gammaproteobacteria bacterium]